MAEHPLIPTAHRLSAVCFATLVSAAAMLVPAAPASALTLTDAVLFSSNGQGGAYGGLAWNTVGSPPDTANRWNLYVSSSSDITSPSWLNGFNDGRTGLDIPLAPGDYTFAIYGEGAGNHGDHFTLSLFFGGDETTPGISAAVPVNSGSFVPAGADNGLGLLECFGPCNFIANAGSLSVSDGVLVATLTAFSWFTASTVPLDLVWPHHHGEGFGGSGTNDFFGFASLSVRAASIPEPGTLGLLAAGLGGLVLGRLNRRARV